MRLEVNTSEYSLDVEDSRFKLRQHTSRNNEETWLNGRQGDLAHSTLRVTAEDLVATVYLDGRNLGTISDEANLDELGRLVEFYNTKLGPTDLLTAKAAVLLTQGRNLVHKTEKIKVFSSTWNTFGSLIKLSAIEAQEMVNYACDVLVLNFQESDALGRNLVANQQTLAATIEKFSRNSHKLASSVQLLGLMTLVFVRQDLKVSGLERDSSGVGFLRVWGNKGAVLTRFTLLQDSILGGGAEFVVVNCHLSAGDKPEQNQRRQWELREISKKFGVPGVINQSAAQFETAAYEFDADADADADESDNEQTPSRYRRADAFDSLSELSEDEEPELPPIPTEKDLPEEPKDLQDLQEPQDSKPLPSKPLPALPEQASHTQPKNQFIIFAGDLNYRVRGDLNEVAELAKSGKYSTILEQDHCSRLHIEKKIFSDFYEHPIAFSPTYKYQLGSHSYDRSMRTPSYTDRIFYKGHNVDFRVNSYTSLPMTISDHRPVISTSDLSVVTLDWTEYNKLVDSAYRMVDKAENLAIPNLIVEPNTIECDTSIFSIPCETIKLISQSNRPVSWHILPNEKVQVSPDNGIIEPNSSQRLVIKSFLGINTAEVNEVIIVHVEGGADRFVSAIFKRAPTLIGTDVERSGPVPEPIKQLVEYLWSRVVPQMFASEGQLSIIHQVIKWLDQNEPLDVEVLDAANSTANGAGSTAAARVLYLVLTNLPSPVMNFDTEKPPVQSDLAEYLLKFFNHCGDFGCPLGSLLDPLGDMLFGKDKFEGKNQQVEKLLAIN